MEKRIEICVGTDRSGGVRARISLLTMSGESVLNESYHSVTLLPGDDPSSVRADVERHLSQPEQLSGIPGSPWGPIPDEEWVKVTGVLPLFHTSEKVATRRALLAQKAAAEEAARKQHEIALQAQAEAEAKAAEEAAAKFKAAVLETATAVLAQHAAQEAARKQAEAEAAAATPAQ